MEKDVMKAPAIRIDQKLQEFLQKLNSLDFGPLVYKLMNPEDRPGLSLDQAVDAVRKYKGFLFLYQANRGRAVSPSRYIDYVWHTHILDTELYSVQTAMLFGNYLHHFPFFGKRDDADEKDLLKAAGFTREQALGYFGWDDDDWCGTSRKPGLPKPGSDIANLANVIFPVGVSTPEINQGSDVVTIQAGNFRHTIEHIGSSDNAAYALRSSRLDYLAQILKLPIWVIVCMPADIGILNDTVVVHQDSRLQEISQVLAAKRLTPEGFSAELVSLEVAA
jgi:hypothetical protein